MDRRGWPWKKKSADKATNEKLTISTDSVGASLATLASIGDQDKHKKANYVQLSLDSYTYLTGLADQVDELKDQVLSYEDEIKDLKEKLSAANLEIKAKESLVMQHAKVTEEAVSGWEKADAEAVSLKRQLESITHLKLSAEERAAHLDDALKECTRQIRSMKEENEQRLHDIIRTRSTQWDKIKMELEGRIDELNQGLLRAESANAALLRSLQERSNLVMQIKEEKSRAEAEIELLESNIESREKEITSLKYELHVASKELDIRHEEKNMSVKSAEIANKQHLEGVKKIAKLEAECQRLRNLVRKRLPGPTGLAQMKLEAENLGHDITGSRMQRGTIQNTASPHALALPDVSVDKCERCKRENELLTKRLTAMEEETKMLKESLAARCAELRASRNVCAKTLSKLRSLETEVRASRHQKTSQNNSLIGSPSGKHTNSLSTTLISEYGADKDRSSPESWSPSTSHFSQSGEGRSINETSKPKISENLELMNDFLEIERLAASGAEEAISISENSSNNKNSIVEEEVSSNACKVGSDPPAEQARPIAEVEPTEGHQLISILLPRISAILKSRTTETNPGKIIGDIKRAIHEIQPSLSQHIAAIPQTDEYCRQKEISPSSDEIRGNQVSLSQDIRVLDRKLYSSEFSGSETLNDEALSGSKDESGLDALKVTSDNNTNSACGSCSEFGNPQELSPRSDVSSCNCSSKDLERLKLEKERIALDLDRCMQDLENTRLELQRKDQVLSTSENLQSLAETQLKCVTESYKSLEARAWELETEVKRLQETTQRLEMALLEEKRSHEDAVVRCNDLQEKIQRNATCVNCSLSSDSDFRLRYEREIAAAEEKLAACHETIYLLGKQLQALQPQTRNTKSEHNEKLRPCKSIEEKPNLNRSKSPDIHYLSEFDQAETDSAASWASEEPSNSSLPPKHSDLHATLSFRSPPSAADPETTLTRSNSFSSPLKAEQEKHPRGLGRFFSLKGKNRH